MIDIESEAVDRVKKALTKSFPGVYVTSEQGKSPPRFPAVSVVMINNPTYERTLTLGKTSENHSAPVLQIDVYSNRTEGGKSECKAVMNAADGVMQDMGLVRFFGPESTPNMLDATVCRQTARYRGIVSKNREIYRR